MTCDERKDLLLMYAADALDESDAREELRAHLSSGCPTCAASLAEAEAVVAHLPTTLPMTAAPSTARDRLMQRVVSSPRTSSSFSSQSRSSIIAIISSIAAVVALCVASWFHSQASDYREKLASAQQQMIELRQDKQQTMTQLAALQQAFSLSSRDNEILIAKNLQLVSLGGGAPQPQASGRVLWDHDRNVWHVSVFNLQPLPPDKVYELWYITPQKGALPAPTFNVDPQGNRTLVLDLPKDIGPIAQAGITIESAGGSKTPTMPIQLAGKVD